MYGPEEKKDEMDITSFGIIPMSCAYLFTVLNDDTHPLAEDIKDFNVRCEFVGTFFCFDGDPIRALISQCVAIFAFLRSSQIFGFFS